MRNIRKVLLLALLGILGCKNGNVENENATNNTNDTIKTDTALVVGKVCFDKNLSWWWVDNVVFVADKNGEIKEFSSLGKINSMMFAKECELLKYSYVGDTVVISLDKKYPCIVKNLTMENKIKANNDIIKADTAIVLAKNIYEDPYVECRVFVADKRGRGYEVWATNENGKEKELYNTVKRPSNIVVKEFELLLKYANAGDTVVVARDKEKPYIIRNLTMENKIKAFSNHR